KAIKDVGYDIADVHIKGCLAKLEEMWTEFGEKSEVYTIPEEEQARWRKAIGDLADRHVEELSAKGYPGKEGLALTRKVIGR
ncbi:MAG: hypothetical protein JW882_10685, partial [Deltaproteobacteria bacterium]|nr:hypothetical protein [Deltaproteobacteria bacterium]